MAPIITTALHKELPPIIQQETSDMEIFKASKRYPHYQVSTEGRVRRIPHIDGKGLPRKERYLIPDYLSNVKDGTKHPKGGHVRLVGPDGTTSYVSVASLVVECHSEGFDRQFHSIEFKNNKPNDARLDNLVARPKFVAKLERRLTNLALRSTQIQVEGGASNAA